MVGADDQREIADMLTQAGCNVSSACAMAGISRSTYRYEYLTKDDSIVEGHLNALTDKHPAIGFWSCHYRLRNRGVKINHKRLYRVYKAMRLNIGRRRKQRLSKKPFSVGLLEPAAEILAFYKEHHYDGEDSFVFPILNPDFLSPVSVKNRIRKMICQVNSDLKQISKELNLEEKKLTTYVARHTFATVLKNSGQSTAVISEALGHDSEHTTQIYLDSFENNVIDEAAKALL